MHSQNHDETVYDITILGGGPTGIFAAFYAGMRNASCKIIDSMPTLGGRLTAVYPEKYIYDVAGFPKVLSRDLIDNLVEQIAPYQTKICLGETAEQLQQQDGSVWCIQTTKGVHLSRTVIIASGVGAYRPKKHTASGAAEYEEKGIAYAVINKSIYAGRRVLIVGGGDSALDWANELAAIAQSVTLVHRNEKFRAHDDSVLKLKKTDTRIILNTEVAEFIGNGERVQKVLLRNTEDGSEETISIDDVVVMIGFNSSLGKIKEWGLELRGNGIVVNEQMQTNLPGVFAAGDMAKYSAKLDLIVTGFSEAAIAVAFAKVYMNPKEKAQPMHSTTLMEIKERKNV